MLKRGLISLVPWFFVFLIVPAAIFTAIEDWSFIDGFYYCFVTLSTIGFGDFVAGNFEKDYIWGYKILVVFWIIFGLAYLSMVLNFIMQSLRSRHISNVMHSLRHRISVTPSFAARSRRHPGHFKRQQSSPVVLFTQNGKKIYPTVNESLNNNFLSVNSNAIGVRLDSRRNSTVIDIDTRNLKSSSMLHSRAARFLNTNQIYQTLYLQIENLKGCAICGNALGLNR